MLTIPEEREFKSFKADFAGKILPPTHPDSVRVRVIAKNIIDALQRGLKKMGYASEHTLLQRIWMGWEGWLQPTTSHLDQLNWEVLVVNHPAVTGISIPGGKIVVSTGLLKNFRSDAAIATVIGHEVGHIVARHHVELVTRIGILMNKFPAPDFIKIRSLVSRFEMEADYIGLLLMASAGYDPQVAPKVLEKMDKFKDTDSHAKPNKDCIRIHISRRERAEVLARPEIMEEALIIYNDVKTRHGVE